MSGAASIPATVAFSISEKDFQQQVVDLADLYHWRHYHTHNSQRSDPGFPDLVLCRPPELMVAELKRQAADPTDAQQDWIAAFVACGVEAYVWRPADWPFIEGRLKLRRGDPRDPRALTR